MTASSKSLSGSCVIEDLNWVSVSRYLEQRRWFIGAMTKISLGLERVHEDICGDDLLMCFIEEDCQVSLQMWVVHSLFR